MLFQLKSGFPYLYGEFTGCPLNYYVDILINKNQVSLEMIEVLKSLLIILFFVIKIANANQCHISVNVVFLVDVSGNNNRYNSQKLFPFVNEYISKLTQKQIQVEYKIIAFAHKSHAFYSLNIIDLQGYINSIICVYTPEISNIYGALTEAFKYTVNYKKNIILILSDFVFYDASNDSDYAEKIFSYQNYAHDKGILIQIASFHYNLK